MQPYLSGKYWWLGVIAIALFSLLLFHILQPIPTAPRPAPVATETAVQVTQPAPTANLPQHPVLDLFDPSASTLSHDQAVTRLRSELEQLFVIAILLQRCSLMNDAEYGAAHAAATQYAYVSRQFRNPEALIADVEEQAVQTYQLVYADTSCTEPSLQGLKTQTDAWVAQFPK